MDNKKTSIEKNENLEYNDGNIKTVHEIRRVSDTFSRALFCKQGNEFVLLDFINSFMLDSNEPPFISLEVLSPYNYKDNRFNFETIVDVKAKTSTGEIVVVEVQTSNTTGFFTRLIEYWSKNLISSSDERKKKYTETKDSTYLRQKPVITIAIVDFIMFAKDSCAHSCHKICNIKTGSVSSDILEFHVLELPKSTETIKTKNLALWHTFFGTENFEEEKTMLAKQNAELKTAVENYDFFRESKDFISEYEKHEIFLHRQACLEAERFEQGVEQGIEQGIEQGELKKARETAKKFLSMGFSAEQVAQGTGLTKEQIEDL